MLKSKILWAFIFVLLLVYFFPTGPNVKTITEDGAWCWFQDPRAVFVKGERTRTYAQWMTHDGRLQVGAYDHEFGESETYTLKEAWDRDDHNVGSFFVLPDKRLMVFYARHNKVGLLCRTSSVPEDISQWEEEVTVSDTDRITYNHPVYLNTEKLFYVFWRGPTWKPTFATSSDGKTWSKPKILVQGEDEINQGIRPYMKVVSDGQSSIHFAFTDGHPRNEDENSLYYLRYESGNFYKAGGTEVGKIDALPIRHSDCDKIYDGASAGRAWVWDIALDESIATLHRLHASAGRERPQVLLCSMDWRQLARLRNRRRRQVVPADAQGSKRA